MLYDYFITQLYPVIMLLATGLIILCIIVSVFYVLQLGCCNVQEKEELHKKYGGKYKKIIIGSLIYVAITALIPDLTYIKNYFGDPRVITKEQRTAIQTRLDAEYRKSNKLFLECLDKGQKQPNTTAFNDTNEVVKTCYEVARIKF